MTTDEIDRAEDAVLGGCLRHNPALADVQQLLREEHFRTDRTRKIWSALCALYDRHGAADLVLLAELLRQRGHLEDCGSYPRLAEIWDQHPTAGAHALHYARLVRDAAICRLLQYAGAEIARDAGDRSAPADELLQSAERKVFSIADLGIQGQAYPLAALVDEEINAIDARRRHQASAADGLPTGFHDLDRMTAGLQAGELVLLAARPSVGKTALGLCIARHVAVTLQQPVFFASLEQSRRELASRLLCAQGHVDGHRLRTAKLSEDECERLVDARDTLRECRFFIDDTPAQSVMRIASNARRHKMRHDIRLVVVDYLQLIDPENPKESENAQLTLISRRLKQLARELRLPILCLAQLNRQVENRAERRPRLADLRGSGSLEQDADVVLLLHRTEEVPGDVTAIDVLVEKQRNGPTGCVTLSFNRSHLRFDNFAVEAPRGYSYN